MRNESHEIEGAADFETGAVRATPLRYTISRPDAGEAKGLVFLIPGFGGDAGPGYAEALRRHVVHKHGFAAVSVQYHCIQARPENGAGVRLDLREHLQLVGMATVYGLKVADWNDLAALCAAFAAAPIRPQVPAVIDCPGGDKQNFGLVQALDHLRVLGELIGKGGFDVRRIIALGSSHGGYIAQLMAKIAPGTLAAVIDNSSYTRAPTAYAGGGAAPECVTVMGGVQLLCRTSRAWSYDDRAAPNFYGPDQDLIRHLAYPQHLAIQRAASPDGGARYRMANAAVDAISSPQAKREQAAALAAAGFDARLQVVGEADLDGRLYKKMVHGLDASLKAFCDLHLPDCPARGVDPDLMRGVTVDYPGIDETYRFRHFDRFPYVEGESVKRAAPEAAQAAAQTAVKAA